MPHVAAHEYHCERRDRTRASLETARRDSRLGYEWENDYFYTPYVLVEKLRQLEKVKPELFKPATRSLE